MKLLYLLFLFFINDNVKEKYLSIIWNALNSKREKRIDNRRSYSYTEVELFVLTLGLRNIIFNRNYRETPLLVNNTHL